MPRSATRPKSIRDSWAELTPEQRRDRTRNARMAYHARQLVANWPELTEEQQQRLRALLRPVGGGHDGR